MSIDHEISDWQTSGIGKSMVDLKNWQKIDRKPPVAPTFIKDGNGGGFSQLCQVGSADLLAARKQLLQKFCKTDR